MENKQEKSKKNIFIVILVVFSIIFYYLLFKNKVDLHILIDEKNTSIHFNLITVNSIFAGFLFSSLSLIVGLNNTTSITKLEKVGFMRNIYSNIMFGIVCSFISIIFSLIMVFARNIIAPVPILINYIIPSIELIFLIYTIIVFINAVIDIKFIIKSVRRNIKKTIPKESDLKETLNLIK